MSCDNCDIYKFDEKKDATKLLNKGLPDPIKSQISTLQLKPLSRAEQLPNCEEQKYMQYTVNYDNVNYDNVNYDKDKLLETEEKKEEKWVEIEISK